MHLVGGRDNAEGLLRSRKRSAVSLVGDDNFFPGKSGIDFSRGEEDLVAVLCGDEDVAGHAFARHAAAKLPSGFDEQVVKQHAFVGGGVAIGGQGRSGARHRVEVCGGKRECRLAANFDGEDRRRGGRRGIGLSAGRVETSKARARMQAALSCRVIAVKLVIGNNVSERDEAAAQNPQKIAGSDSSRFVGMKQGHIEEAGRLPRAPIGGRKQKSQQVAVCVWVYADA